MATDEKRLKDAIAAAMVKEQSETKDANLSLDRLSTAIAKAVINEITNIGITYTGGLTAGGNAVTGVFRFTIQ